MTQIILDGAIVESPWQTIHAGDGSTAANVLVPQAEYLASAPLQARDDAGAWVAAEDNPQELEGVIDSLSVIAVHFPAFTDGRALSHAAALGTRCGFAGEIRAFGDVRRDQMEQMLQCGINAFKLPEGADLDAALAGLRLFSHSYQSSTNRPDPLFRLR